MSIVKFVGCGVSAALASWISIGSTQAAMAPTVGAGNPNVQYADCAVGFHIGPAGACILGADNDPPPPPRAVIVDPPPVVVQPNDGGCVTKSVKRTDSEGNSETKTKSNCD